MAVRHTEAETSLKRERVVTAAIEVFLRYGHARTTMNDVAAKAGISRPALYLLFPRKEDIFAAAVERLQNDKLREFRGAMSKLGSLDQKLHYCCEHWAGEGYDLTEAHPDAADVFDLSFPPVRAMYAALEALFAGLLRDAVAASKLKATPEELARVLIFGMRGLKSIAEDGVHMRRLIALHVDVVLQSLRPR